jgi:hypothetical protein
MPAVDAVSSNSLPATALAKAVLPARPWPSRLNLLRFHGLLPCCSAWASSAAFRSLVFSLADGPDMAIATCNNEASQNV